MAIKEMHFSCSNCNASVYGNYVILLSGKGSLGFCSRKCIIEFLLAAENEPKLERTEAPLAGSAKKPRTKKPK